MVNICHDMLVKLQKIPREEKDGPDSPSLKTSSPELNPIPGQLQGLQKTHGEFPRLNFSQIPGSICGA